jgi:FlaA1/EpsC-like NDP-sugar epimerase
MAELIVQDLATRATQTIFSTVRFGNVLGSSGSVIPLFQEQIARGGPVTLTDDRVTRYFMTIQEASRLVLLAGSFAEGGEVFVLDMGQPVRVGDLARRMIVAAGYSVRDAGNPAGDIEIVVTGLRPGEKLHEELMMRRGAQITAHPKIIRVREDHLSEIEMAAILRDLRAAVDGGHDADMLEVVVRAVREYAPQNLPDAALQVQIARAGRRAIHAAEQSAPGARPDHAPNGSSGYPTPHRYRPCGGQTGPQAARSRASSAAFTSSGAQAPAPTRSSVPTIDRT